MKKFAIALALGVAVGGASAAAALDKPVNARQLNQERRIDAGVRSGKLTQAEAARLKAQQSSIRGEEAQMRAANGGKLTEHDKKLIHARQDSANAGILKQKNDAQKGPGKSPF